MKKDKAPQYMTTAQRSAFTELLEALGGVDALTIPDRIRVEVLACLLVEVRALQTFTNQHGTTYEVIGKSGDLYSRARPEHQQLNEARTKVAQLTRQLTTAGHELPASIDELLQ